jgi:mono/diheme cytochrome c family protein
MNYDRAADHLKGQRRIRTIGQILGMLSILLVIAVIFGGGGLYLWSTTRRDAILSERWDVPESTFPIPYPLTAAEVDQLRAEKLAAMPPMPPPLVDPAVPVDPNAPVAPPPDPLAGVDLDAIATERAVARGKHLVETTYGCQECHGADFGGHVVMQNLPMGTFACPNITSGEGSVTQGFTSLQWDRIVRHGVRPDGSTTLMPAEDFAAMSDHELSDIVAYIQSIPPVDRPTVKPELGPVFTVLLAAGQIVPAAYKIDHAAAHAEEPPPLSDTVEFGAHLAQTCHGCHGSELAGGPIKGGDPSWPPAANLTQSDQGLKGWTYDDFLKVVKEGKRKDGGEVKEPMPWKMLGGMTDEELKALWAYLQTVPAKETPK